MKFFRNKSVFVYKPLLHVFFYMKFVIMLEFYMFICIVLHYLGNVSLWVANLKLDFLHICVEVTDATASNMPHNFCLWSLGWLPFMKHVVFQLFQNCIILLSWSVPCVICLLILSLQLFRSMCTTWIKVDRLHQDEIDRVKRGEESTTATPAATATATWWVAEVAEKCT